jgi:hypothetical protein
MVAVVADNGRIPDYHYSMAEAVTAARVGPATEPFEEG